MTQGLDLTKPIEVEATFEYNGDGMYDVSFRLKRMDVTEEEGRDYRCLFEAAPATLSLLKEMYIFLAPTAQRLFDKRYFELLDDIGGAQSAARQALSDLALIDMHIPNMMPLESGSSDFGFVNKFDASGRSLSGGDIA